MPTYHLFSEEGNFYKANLHSHSTLSDGKFTPEELKDVYKSMGYSILAYTDHEIIVPHPELRDENFLPLTSTEIAIVEDPNKYVKSWPCCKVYHLNFYSRTPERDTFFPFEQLYSVENIQKMIDDGNKEGFLVQYNHARWSYQSQEDFKDLQGLFSFEIYNHCSELSTHNGWSDYEYEWYSRFGRRAAAVATDDCHCDCPELPNRDCGGGWTMIHAPELSYDAIIAAMDRKECYASTGPEIYKLDLTTEPGRHARLRIECSPCWHVAVLTDCRMSAKKLSAKNDITVFETEVPENFDFFRVECKDAKGKAMSRAYFPDEFEW